MVQLRRSISQSKDRGTDLSHNGLTTRLVKRGGEAVTNRARGLTKQGTSNDAMFSLVSMISGILGGALAGALFNRVWRAVSGADDVPEPTALDRKVGEVLIAGVLQGAVFGLVKAIVGRITAASYRRFTGDDPRR
jgi:F0F1-type ATP synthase assembly protein I